MMETKFTIKIFLSYIIVIFVVHLSFRIFSPIIGTILSSILSLLIALLISRTIERPLSSITKTAEDVAKGNLEKRVDITSKDEIGRLALSFNRMIEELQSRIETVTEERTLIQTVLRNIADSVFVVDREGKIIFTNPNFEELFAETTDRYYYELIRNQEVNNLLERTLIDGLQGSIETSLYLPTERMFHIYTAPIKERNKVTGARAVLQDITEIKRLEKTRMEFVANVSHELKTPLTAIQGAIETLSGGGIKKISSKEFTDIIERQTKRLANLISDLLDLSGIESKQREMEFEEIDIKTTMEKIFTNFKRRAEKKSQRFSLHLPAQEAFLEADAEKIEQAIVNLVDNAIKFTPDRGEVALSLSVSKEIARIEVSDTGPGIPTDDIPRIFERFYRVDKARSRELGGTGLGLSIVKHIVSAHNGEVGVETEIGKGSKFIITLPRAVSSRQ